MLLKRGMSATVEDLLMSAEYIFRKATDDVVLCERGVKGFDKATRNLYDVAAVPLVKGCRTCRSSSIPATRPAGRI